MGLRVNERSHFFDFRNYHRSGGKTQVLKITTTMVVKFIKNLL